MKRWSFTTLLNYEKCPYSTTFPYRQVDNEFTARGREVHERIAEALISKQPTTELRSVLSSKVQSNLAPILVEESYYLSEAWEDCPRSSAWLVVKPDLVIREEAAWVVVDFKTGKSFGNELKHGQQVQLYQVALAHIYPEVGGWRSELWYVDEDKVVASGVNGREKILKMRPRWDQRGHAFTDATAYPPKPSKMSCKYCFEKDRCEFAYEE